MILLRHKGRRNTRRCLGDASPPGKPPDKHSETAKTMRENSFLEQCRRPALSTSAEFNNCSNNARQILPQATSADFLHIDRVKSAFVCQCRPRVVKSCGQVLNECGWNRTEVVGERPYFGTVGCGNYSEVVPGSNVLTPELDFGKHMESTPKLFLGVSS